MKVSFNQITQINNYKQVKITKPAVNIDAEKRFEYPKDKLTLANFPNVSFKARLNPEAQFLLSQTKWLRCAYSDTVMIHPEIAKSIYQKLLKKPNAQSAINYLQQYQKIMHNVESQVFDIFVDAPRKGKRDFQDILKEQSPEALERLKLKQNNVLHSTDYIVEKLSPSVAEQVIKARDIALNSIEKGPFRRQTVLSMIKAISSQGEDSKRLKKIHKAWYQLPSSTTDIDAFIVKYSSESHNIIAKRLISGAVATIEHIKPHSRGGLNSLSNYLLVSAEFNSNRQSMPLDEYINLTMRIDMKSNIQKYINSVISEISDRKGIFFEASFYPLEITESIRKETKGTFEPDTSALRLSKNQRRDNEYSQKLGEIFTLLKK